MPTSQMLHRPLLLCSFAFFCAAVCSNAFYALMLLCSNAVYALLLAPSGDGRKVDRRPKRVPQSLDPMESSPSSPSPHCSEPEAAK